MKTGEKTLVGNFTLLDPLVGRIIECEIGGEEVTVRLTEVGEMNSTVTVVPKGTRE